MNNALQAIWEISVLSVPAIALLGICSPFFGKRYGVRWRYLLWLVIAVRLLLPVRMALPQNLPISLPVMQSQTMLWQEAEELPVITEGAKQEKTMAATSATKSDFISIPQVQETTKNNRLWNGLQNELNRLWLAGVAIFWVWQAWKYIAFRRMLQRNRRQVLDAAALDCYYAVCREMQVTKRPALYFCHRLHSPLCMGFFNQEIYINSEERTPEELRLILQHELTHCKRKDIWAKLLLLWARGLHFFNPFVHWMVYLAERDMELSCDAAVMKNCTLEERQAYSMTILGSIRERRYSTTRLTTAFFGGKEELKRRFEYIFDMETKKRGIAVFLAMTMVFCGGMTFVGCVPVQETKPVQSAVVYGDYTEEMLHELYESKLAYIGNHVGVGKILGLLPLPDGVTYHEEGMELFTAEPPYGAARHLNWAPSLETTYILNGEVYQDDRWFFVQGMIFLALVENADLYQLFLHQGDIEVVKQFTREDGEIYFGETDLREFAKDEDVFRSFVQVIYSYFYEGVNTPEEIHALLTLDETAARKRMKEMLQKSTIHGSFLEQMIQANTLAGVLAEQKLTSSNSFDYLQCEEYEELVALGEPALREFLSAFAMGEIGDDLYGQIIMLACQEMLGQEQRTDLSPTEWYGVYAALDSLLMVPFSANRMIYTSEVEKAYSLGYSAGKKWNIAAAGRDEALKAVYDALAERYNKGQGHQVNFFAPLVCHMQETEDTLQVFAVIWQSDFALSNTNAGYGLFEQGGSVIPTRLDFQRRENRWVLTDWIEAKDGSYYSSSIQEMCKEIPGLAEEMLYYDNDACRQLLWQNIIYYMKANYNGMNVPIYVTSYMEEAEIGEINQWILLLPTYGE